MKKYIHFLGICAIFIFFCAIFPSSASNNSEVRIVTTNPCVGLKIETEVSNIDETNVHYIWSIADEIVDNTENYYVPGAQDYESWISVSVIDNKTNKVLCSDKIYFSELPVVYINTEANAEIESRSEYINADMQIQGNQAYEMQYDGKIEIKGRGTSSWHYDKKPYKIKLNKKTDLFGFGKSKHYVLLANYLDPSLMRNALGYNLASKLGLVTTNSTWVDVVLNGEYIGNYQLCEQIRIGKQLVDIFDYEDFAKDTAKTICKKCPEDFPSGSSELESYMEENLDWITTSILKYNSKVYIISDFTEIPTNLAQGFLYELCTNNTDRVSYFTTKGGIKAAISKPEYLSSSGTLFGLAQDMLQDFEDALTSTDGYNEKGVHYSQLANMDSMISYWLTNEIMSNEDAVARSRFCFINNDGQIEFGPVWDFDISSGAFRAYFPAEGWNVTSTVTARIHNQDLFGEFVNDPYFMVLAMEKYWEIRDYLGKITEDGGIIDTLSESIYESGVTNSMMWTQDGIMSYTFDGEKSDIQILKSFLSRRIAWLDKQFTTEDTLVQSLDLPLAKSPYTINSDVGLSIKNLAGDELIHGAKYYSEVPCDVSLCVSVPQDYTVSIYVNGIKANNYLSTGISWEILLDEKLLTNKNSKNVISVVAEKETTVLTNFTTVRLGNYEETVDDDTTRECEHVLAKVDARDAKNERYGLVDSYYCEKCHKYFTDENGETMLSKKDAILQYTQSDESAQSEDASQNKENVFVTPYFIIAISVLIIVIFAIAFIAIAVRRHNTCAKKKP